MDDGHHAEIFGKEAEVVSLDDKGMLFALKSPELERPTHGIGPDIQAWMFPHNYYKIKRHKE